MFRRLAIFVDGFELGAAEAVASFGDIKPAQVFDLLARLADKSLMRADHEAERYHLLATIHEYASEKLAEAGEDDQARRAHLAYTPNSRSGRAPGSSSSTRRRPSWKPSSTALTPSAPTSARPPTTPGRAATP